MSVLQDRGLTGMEASIPSKLIIAILLIEREDQKRCFIIVRHKAACGLVWFSFIQRLRKE